jgi:hypothetical protein
MGAGARDNAQNGGTYSILAITIMNDTTSSTIELNVPMKRNIPQKNVTHDTP